MSEPTLTKAQVRRVWEILDRARVIDEALIQAIDAVLATWIDLKGTPTTLGEAMRQLEAAYAEHEGAKKRF